MRNYRDLQVWNKAHALTLNLYRLSRTFPKQETYGLTSQLRRAAVSIGANLAEGCGRRTSGELARFVRIAMGSASELDYHLLLCCDLGLLKREEFNRTSRELTEVRKMLTSFLARIEAQAQEKSSAARA
ncbi:MAG TPA: four helix bundle protein [Terriglobales bacterium]|nr:four helix bundle protein [Terriglobales bacterium]